MLTSGLNGGERTVVAPRVWPDAYLEHWGAYYVNHPEILERGVRFETFLFAPVEILKALRNPEIRVEVDAGALYQAAHRSRSVLERLGARVSNGALVEKLRHHRAKRARHRRRDGDGRLI